MKIFSAGKPANRSAAMNCLLVNQFATPGLGSLMGKRWVEGTLQLLLAVVGCVMAIWGFVHEMWGMFQSFGSGNGPGAFPWFGKVGIILFVTSWLLSWITSLSLLRAAKNTHEKEIQTKLPPKLPPKINRD